MSQSRTEILEELIEVIVDYSKRLTPITRDELRGICPLAELDQKHVHVSYLISYCATRWNKSIRVDVKTSSLGDIADQCVD